MYNAGKDVSAKMICAEYMFRAWKEQAGGSILHNRVVVINDYVGKDSHNYENTNDDKSENGGLIFLWVG